MKFWRGSIHLLSSGSAADNLDLFGSPGLPKDPKSAIPTVFQQVRHTSHIFYGRTWRTSMTGYDPHSMWLAFMIGTESSTRDEWSDPVGWIPNAGPRTAATYGLIHIPSQTVFIQKRNQELENTTVFKALTKLLNGTLHTDFPATGWIFELFPEKETGQFLTQLRQLDVINLFRVTLPTPNARSHDLLKDLQGEAGDAKADHVDIVLRSDKGVSKSSSFFKNCLDAFTDGLAKIVVQGRKRDSAQKVTLNSENQKVLTEHEIPDLTDDAVLEVSNGPAVARAIGFIGETSQQHPALSGGTDA